MLQKPTRFPIPGFYYHYKHDPEKGIRDYAYEVIALGFHTEEDCDPEDACMVAYRPLYETALMYQTSQELKVPVVDIRPISMFMETVQKDAKTTSRFQKITDPAVVAALEIVRDEMYPF